jgi:hypothetical protein
MSALSLSMAMSMAMSTAMGFTHRWDIAPLQG